MADRARLNTVRWRALCLAALCAAACGSEPHAGPHLLLVTFDTTRRDHTSLHGYSRETTPRLKALAAEGARFELAYAPSATTAPTHATLFTGRYPISHGVRKNGVALSDEARTLAEHLREAGFETAGWIGSYVLTRRFGLAQGFAHWDEEFPAEGATSDPGVWEGHEVEGGFDRRADVSTDRAIAWLERRPKSRPFFLFVHYYDPHSPYRPPEDAARFDVETADPAEEELAASVAAYDAEIRFTDAQLGRLLDALGRLGLADQTLVAVTADHGEGLMQHGLMGHGLHVYEEQVRVPLVVRFPAAIAAGTVVSEPVELLDLAPSLVELLGLPRLSAEAVGRSLAPALRGGAPPETRPTFLYRRHFAGEERGGIRAVGEKFAVRDGRWKYIEGPEEQTFELFDLEADPDEQRDLYRPDHPEALRLSEAIAAWRATHGQDATADPEVAEDVRKGLEVLGYVE